jgi:hypothetical protein
MMSRIRLPIVLALGIVPGVVGGWLIRGHAAGTAATAGPMIYAGTLYNGNTPVEGAQAIQVDLWDDATAGTKKCSTRVAAVTVTAGRFRIPLDVACTTAAQAAPNLWSEVLVNDVSLGRTPINAVPYAVQAGTAAQAVAATQAGSVPWAGITGAPDVARVSAHYYANDGLVLASGARATFEFGSKDFDTNTAVSAGPWRFQVPAAGKYRVDTQVNAYGAQVFPTGALVSIFIMHQASTGAPTQIGYGWFYVVAGNNGANVHAFGAASCAVNDKLWVEFMQSNGQQITMGPQGGGFSQILIEREGP